LRRADQGFIIKARQTDIARVAKTIAKYEPVVMCANPSSAAHARKMCGPAVTVMTSIPVDDCWMRDSGPIFRTNGDGERDAVGLNFNGWGDSQIHGKDQHVAQRVADYAGVPFTAADFVGEGGAIETDGDGTVMATESSLVNSNRNPGMSKSQVQAAVLEAFGATTMIWFPGIVGHDITDDHVDATSRFVASAKGMVQYPPGSGTNIWNEDERKQYEILSTSMDAKGRPIQVTKLIGPEWHLIRQSENLNFVDSYVNYYACNGAVIAAQFGDPKADAAAKQTLADAFPGCVVEQLNVDHLGLGGGGIHCVTQQEPQA
jgi:agmatine deiminase